MARLVVVSIRSSQDDMRQTPFHKGVSGLSARHLQETGAPHPQSRSSSVVERIIGNDEVGSSILPCGTSFIDGLAKIDNALKRAFQRSRLCG